MAAILFAPLCFSCFIGTIPGALVLPRYAAMPKKVVFVD